MPHPQPHVPLFVSDKFEGESGTGLYGDVMSGDGKWKLHVPNGYRTSPVGGRNGMPGFYQQDEIGLSLYVLVHDPYEKVNVIDKYPEVADRLIRFAEQHRTQFFEE